MSIILALIIFGVLVLIHEFGHFIAAKKNGIVVNEFSIGMGPRLFSFQKGETRYSIKILPLGGSCAMLGEDQATVEDGSFNSKSVLARFTVIAAGPVFNFVLAWVLALIVIGAAGTDISYVQQMDTNSSAYEAGLRDGDRIVKYNGSSASLGRELYLEQFVNPLNGEPIEVTYIRDGKKNTITYMPEKEERYLMGMNYTDSASEAQISVAKDSVMDEAGVESGDVITAIDGTKISSGKELSSYLEDYPVSQNEVKVTVDRKGEEHTYSVTPKMSTVYSDGYYFNLAREKQSVLNTIKYSFVEVRYQISTVIKSLKMLVFGQVDAGEVSGPVGIVSVIGDTYNETKTEGILIAILSMINMAIMLSANLGVMNLLPIPALDGGRLVFLIIEGIRRKPIDRDKEGFVHFIGFACLMILMAFLLFNDIAKLI